MTSIQNPRRVLLLSPFFYPEPISSGKYNTLLASALVEEGFSVEVICFHPTYPDWRVRRDASRLAGVSIRRGGAWVRFPKSGVLRRVFLEIGFGLHLLRNIGRIRRCPLIVTVLPPMLYLPAVRLLAGPNAHIVAIVHDIQGIMVTAGNRSARRITTKGVQLLERWILGYCRRVIALSREMASFLIEQYGLQPAKTAVCMPFVTIGAQAAEGIPGGIFAKGKLHVVYAGALGEKQHPNALISFFRALARKRADVICHVFSRGPIFEALARQQAENHTPRLVFHDLVPEEDLSGLYRHSHLQIIPQQTDISHGAIPSKLPNLLFCGAPLLYVGQKDGDLWRMITHSGAGLCSDSWAPEILLPLAEQLLQHHDSYRTHILSVFKAEFAQLFDISNLIREIKTGYN